MERKNIPSTLFVLIGLLLSGCTGLERLGQVGQMQKMTQIRNPQSDDGYNKVTMPMPNPEVSLTTENSLWRTGARSFFKDQRAADVGDILTILIQFNDSAKLKNDSQRSRNTTEHIEAPNVLGYEKYLPKIFPDTVQANNLVNFASNPTYQGHGQIDRSEALDVKVAATVTQLLPNGNLVIRGRQEIRVNNEVRELVITGIVRPQDIVATNTVSYEKIAEARISYGGRGQISDVQESPWGQQLFDVISPF